MSLEKVAIIGATGAVGRVMLTELERFSSDLKVGLFASERSAGARLSYAGSDLQVEAYSLERLAAYNYVLMSAGGSFSRQEAPKLVEQGAVVIDNSSAWRQTPEVPLIVPEVNGELISGLASGIIANPNCSTIQMVLSLKPLADRFGLRQVQVATYQSVSGAGQKGIDELHKQNLALASRTSMHAEQLPRVIGNNLVPAIDTIDEQTGICFEEEKMVRETQKILSQPDLVVLPTTVRVPITNCHGEAITVTLRDEVTRQDVLEAFESQNGLHVSAGGTYDELPTPQEAFGTPGVYVSRVRLPLGQNSAHVVQYWNVADNLTKGAATNAVQILQRFY